MTSQLSQQSVKQRKQFSICHRTRRNTCRDLQSRRSTKFWKIAEVVYCIWRKEAIPQESKDASIIHLYKRKGIGMLKYHPPIQAERHWNAQVSSTYTSGKALECSSIIRLYKRKGIGMLKSVTNIEASIYCRLLGRYWQNGKHPAESPE